MGRTAGWLEGASVIAILILCLALTFAAIKAGERLVEILGRTGADVVSRISGILLAGLAVQFIFDGLTEASFFHS